jgi:beta-glucosidase
MNQSEAKRVGFPRDFVWGAAAAAYQIEGAAREDGKGLSVWDVFCRKTGAIWNGQSGDAACDHYHRWREDVKLMQSLGLKAYRLSVGWPRVLPEGVGRVNRKGLDFYDRLVDALLAAGIHPFVTLFHWDYPFALYCRGGWLNRDSADWFAEYASVLGRRLGDRVVHWITLNEPQCFVQLGHSVTGNHAPGAKLSLAEVLLAAHHSMLAHGKGVQALRAAARGRCRVGCAPVGSVKIPATPSARDVAAAKKSLFTITAPHLWTTHWWMDAAFFGRYPADGIKVFGQDMPEVSDADLRTIAQPMDFLGLNIYSAERIRAGRHGKPEVVKAPDGHGLTAFKWFVEPEALYYGPKWYAERYKVPIYITENGMSGADWIALDGKVHDPQRIDFTRRYLRELRRAIADGADVRGYFHWSIMDNFEWAEGFKERFGLVYVDYPTQKRIPKDSAYWYAEVIRSNGATV